MAKDVAGQSVFSLSRDEFLKRLSAGDTTSIFSADPESYAEVLGLGTEAPYYLSYYFRDADNVEGERAMLTLAWNNSSGIWKTRAGLRLLELYGNDAQASGSADELEQFSQKYIEALPATFKGYESLLKALFIEQRDAELVRRARTAVRQIPSLDPESEAMLRAYEAVASARLGAQGWTGLFTDLFFTRPYAPAHRFAYDFLAQSDGKDEAFKPNDVRAIKGREFIAEREYGKAAEIFAYLVGRWKLDSTKSRRIPDPSPLVLKYPLLFQDAGKAYLYGGMSKDGVPLFAAIADSLLARKDPASIQNRFICYFYEGKMLVALGKYPEAIDAFSRALLVAPDRTNRDAVMWYTIDAASRTSPEASFPYIERFAGSWGNPKFFSDILDRFCIRLSGDKNWPALKTLFSLIDGKASETMQARLAYIVGRAYELGYLEDRTPVSLVLKNQGDVPGFIFPRSFPETAGRYYRKALALESAPYYRMLSAWRLDAPLELADTRDLDADKAEPSDLRSLAGDSAPAVDPLSVFAPPPQPAAPLPSGAESYVEGFFKYGLSKYAYPEAVPYFGVLSAREIVAWSTRLASLSNYSDSMRFMDRLASRGDFELDRNDLILLYPRPFKSEAQEASSKNGLPENLFYGLIKSESYFRPAIVSHAGAVGLSQLMPSTARFVADYLGISSPDLTDPSTNLAIGAFYLKDLIGMAGGRPLLAILGYNGGPNRVKRWIQASPGLPPDLLLETVPLEETREYGRSVLSAGAYYGYLYYGKSAAQSVREVLGGEAAVAP